MLKDDPWMRGGGPAFPVRSEASDDQVTFRGMSLRDWFAGQALSGMMETNMCGAVWDDYAQDAYAMADAMLRKRQIKVEG